MGVNENAGVGTRTLDNTGMSRALLPLSYTGKIKRRWEKGKMMISHRLENHLVRKKLVAGVGFEPTTSGL